VRLGKKTADLPNLKFGSDESMHHYIFSHRDDELDEDERYWSTAKGQREATRALTAVSDVRKELKEAIQELHSLASVHKSSSLAKTTLSMGGDMVMAMVKEKITKQRAILPFFRREHESLARWLFGGFNSVHGRGVSAEFPFDATSTKDALTPTKVTAELGYMFKAMRDKMKHKHGSTENGVVLGITLEVPLGRTYQNMLRGDPNNHLGF